MAEADMRSVAEECFGPTLIFVYGNPIWSFLYRRIVHALRTDYERIASVQSFIYPSFYKKAYAISLSHFIKSFDSRSIIYHLCITQSSVLDKIKKSTLNINGSVFSRIILIAYFLTFITPLVIYFTVTSSNE